MMDGMSGRSLESLQAEAALLLARQDLAWYERYRQEAVKLMDLFTDLVDEYPDHQRTLGVATSEAQSAARWAETRIPIVRRELEAAEIAWEEYKDKP